jgi:hypothetical protein
MERTQLEAMAHLLKRVWNRHYSERHDAGDLEMFRSLLSAAETAARTDAPLIWPSPSPRPDSESDSRP